MTAVLAIMLALMAAGMVALALRLSGVNTDLGDALRAKKVAEDNSITVAEEAQDYKRRTKLQLKGLREDIGELEDDLEKCATPGSRRNRLRSLLSKASEDPPAHTA